MCTNRNDEYFERCDNLYYLILKAYINQFLLETIEFYNKTIENGNVYFGKRSFNVLVHITELIKSDLALIVWKICLDEDKEANTLRHLNGFMHNAQIGKKVSPKLSSKYNAICSDLKDIRNMSIAHEDIHQNKICINIADLNGMLNEIKDIYNALCDSAIDDRVQQITSQNIDAIKFNSTLGLLSIIQCDSTMVRENISDEVTQNV